MKRMLMLASVASMIDQFNMSNIELLQEMGYEVHVACNFEKGSTCTDEKVLELKKKLKQLHVRFFQIDFERNVMKLNQDLKAYKQVLKLARKYHYTFIHCHSPIGGVVGRMVGHKTNTKVIYTAHGFHFYKGAPLLNWLIYYPIEKFLSRFTDVLITINQEDYHRAKSKFHAQSVEYVPGVGIDLEKIQDVNKNKENLRKELKILENNKIIISVGELSYRKNHQIVIKALKNINNVTYLICGQGELKESLQNLAKSEGVDLRLLGFRKDVIELVKSSDMFVFPSLQEGLPVALMEAMACKVPCIASAIRGNEDLLEKENLYNPYSVEELKSKIQSGVVADYNMKKYDISNIKKKMKKIYGKEI